MKILEGPFSGNNTVKHTKNRFCIRDSSNSESDSNQNNRNLIPSLAKPSLIRRGKNELWNK